MTIAPESLDRIVSRLQDLDRRLDALIAGKVGRGELSRKEAFWINTGHRLRVLRGGGKGEREPL